MLDAVRQADAARGNLRGLLHLLIGRRISLADGTEVSGGLTWRQVAALLTRARWEREAVRELGLDPAALPPRDRERYWYTAIGAAAVHAPEAVAAGDRLVEALRGLGYVVGPPPGAKTEEQPS
jgi:hypothetical protein